MIVLWIVLGIISLFLLGCTIAGIVCWYKLALPNMKPLTEAEKAACKRIVASKRGYPFMCAYAVKKGMCACLPCAKMEKVKKQIK